MIDIKSRVKVMEAIDGKHSVIFNTGTVLYIGQRYLVEFDSNICGHNGNVLESSNHHPIYGVEKLKEEEVLV